MLIAVSQPLIKKIWDKKILYSGPGTVLLCALAFILFSSLFFLCIGHEPLGLLWAMLKGAFGDGYSISEAMVKTAPILLCALATAIPARLGLISVGAEGQLYIGALFGSGLVLQMLGTTKMVMLPTMLLAAAVGGALWALIPALLKAKLRVNETISTLLLNYVASLCVDFLVYGPWKDPNNLGWPATVYFPDAAKLPTYFDTRMHFGLLIGIIATIIFHFLVTKTRWGISLRILKSNQHVAEGAGLRYIPNVLLVMAIGGMLAGIAGIAETSVIQGRLQSGISNGLGFSGFLVAWLAGKSLLRLIPLSIMLGGLLASGDSLQLMADLPSSIALVLQGLLFASTLLVMGWVGKLKT